MVCALAMECIARTARVCVCVSDVLTAVSTSVVWLTGFTDFFVLIFLYIYLFRFVCTLLSPGP